MRNEMIERPADRYGRHRLSRSNRRWIAIGLTVLVLAIGVGIAVIASQRLGTGEVKGELGGYQLVDGETVEVTITVTRDDPSRPVVCIVRARSIDGSETGRREVLVPRRRRRPCRSRRSSRPVGRRWSAMFTAAEPRPVLPGGLGQKHTNECAAQQTPNCEFVKFLCTAGATMVRYTVLLGTGVLLLLVR